LKKLANKFNLIITAEEGTLNCGFGSAVLEFYAKENLLGKVRVIRVGFPDEFIPAGSREKLFDIYGLGASFLAKKIKKLLQDNTHV